MCRDSHLAPIGIFRLEDRQREIHRMRIDLHIHTSPRSACSYLDPLELGQEAQRLKLDGICLTEHQVLWDIGDVEKLAKESGVKIFRGNEFTTNQGDILVFGFYNDIKELLMIQELREKVNGRRIYDCGPSLPRV